MKRWFITGLVALMATVGLVGVSSPALAVGPYFFYTASAQSVISDGALVNFTIEKPYLNPADFHSLVELAVTKDVTAGHRDIVEVGWTVDPNQFGDSNPHLFFSWWVNEVFQCYNFACPGLIDQTPTVHTDDPGMSLGSLVTTPSTSRQFAIEHANGAWWFGYNSQWIAYINDTNWPGSRFTKSDHIVGQGELAANTLTPCSDIGNGIVGNQTPGTSSRVGSLALFGTATAPTWDPPHVTPSTASPTKYKVDMPAITVRTFWYGGPGFNAAGTGAGTTGSC